jgi:hypothetical protein
MFDRNTNQTEGEGGVTRSMFCKFSENGETYTQLMPEYEYADILEMNFHIVYFETYEEAQTYFKDRYGGTYWLRQNYKNPRVGLTSGQIGDTKAVYGIGFREEGTTNPLTQSKAVVVEFIKGNYVAWVSLFGTSENKLGTKEFRGVTQASVPTLKDAEKLARIIEAKLPGESSSSSALSSGSWFERHPIATGVLTGAAIVGGALAAGTILGGVAAVGTTMLGNTTVINALIGAPIVGRLFARFLFNPNVSQFMAIYGQFVDDFVFAIANMKDKAIENISNSVDYWWKKYGPEKKIPGRRHWGKRRF